MYTFIVSKKRRALSSLVLTVLTVLGLTAACSSADETKCVDSAYDCGNGKLQSCAVGDSNKCKRGFYKTPDGKTFEWASCENTAQAQSDGLAHCAALAGGAQDASTD